MAGVLQAGEQSPLLEAFATDAGGFGDPVGVAEQHVARFEHGLLTAVIGLRLQANQQAGGIEPLHLLALAPPNQGRIVGRIGVPQQAAGRIKVGIEKGDEAMGVGQILLGQLVEVMEDAIGGEPREHLSPQHAAQQAHQ